MQEKNVSLLTEEWDEEWLETKRQTPMVRHRGLAKVLWAVSMRLLDVMLSVSKHSDRFAADVILWTRGRKCCWSPRPYFARTWPCNIYLIWIGIQEFVTCKTNYLPGLNSISQNFWYSRGKLVSSRSSWVSFELITAKSPANNLIYGLVLSWGSSICNKKGIGSKKDPRGTNH